MTYPDILHVDRNTIRRDTFVIYVLENKIFSALVDEPLPQLDNLIFELLRLENFVRKCSESKVKVI